MRRTVSFLVLYSAFVSSTYADTANVIFNGTVAATCTMGVVTNGTMTVSTNLQSLSSHNAGGSAGSVVVNTTGSVSLSVDPVTVTTVPATDVTPITWSPTYSAAGAHTISETPLPTALSVPGTSTVTVHVAGTKTGNNRFAQGNYQATVTVRCE